MLIINIKDVWKIYVLYSKKLNKSYVGCSYNIKERLKKHNSGQVKSTKSGKPWLLVYQEEIANYQEARRKEKYYKSASGRKKLKQIFKTFKERCESG